MALVIPAFPACFQWSMSPADFEDSPRGVAFDPADFFGGEHSPQQPEFNYTSTPTMLPLRTDSVPHTGAGFFATEPCQAPGFSSCEGDIQGHAHIAGQVAFGCGSTGAALPTLLTSMTSLTRQPQQSVSGSIHSKTGDNIQSHARVPQQAACGCGSTNDALPTAVTSLAHQHQPSAQGLDQKTGPKRGGKRRGRGKVESTLSQENDAPAGEKKEQISNSELPDWKDGTTTVMVRNIPSRYTVEELVSELLIKDFTGKFDFFYLPMDFHTKRNKGYAFVNFSSPENAVLFFREFNGAQLPKYGAQKTLQINRAQTQGLQANLDVVQKDKGRIQNPWFRPMVFDTQGEEIAM